MTAERSGALLTRGPLLRATVLFGWPLVLAMAFHSLFNLVDLYIVGKLPNAADAIAAATIPSLVSSIPMIFYNGIVNSAIALIARHAGLGNHRRGNFEAGQGIVLSVVLGVVLGVPPFLFAREICQALGASGNVLESATVYLEVMSLGTVTMFLLLQVTGAIRAAGNSTLPMALLIGANVLNVVLAVWWVFGNMGWRGGPVVGAAWATVVSRGIVMIPAFAFLYRGFAGLRLRRFVFRWKIQWRILRIGGPACAQWMVRMFQYLYLMTFVSNATEGAERVAAQAAFGIGLRLDTLALFSGFGWGAAASTVVGQNLGAGSRERAIQASWIAVGLNVAMMLVFAAAYVLFADPLIRLMGADVKVANFDDVARIGRTYLHVSSAGYVYLAIGVVLSQAMAGAGSTKPSFVIEFLGYLVLGLPVAWFVSTHSTSLRALWLTALATHLAVATAYVIWFRRGRWTEPSLR